MTDFAALASRAPHHDPTTCTREPCSRCRPKDKPRVPTPVDHQVRTPPTPRVVAVDRLHQQLRVTADDLTHLGATTWRRFADWQEHPDHGRSTLRGGGLADAKTDDRIQDEQLDRQAARYFDELATITRRLEADLSRLRQLFRIANPDRPPSLTTGELSTAQLIADGWCPSCFRNDKHLTPIAQGRYRDRCRQCGEYRAATGRDPSLQDLRIMHSRGKRLRQHLT